MKKMRWRQLAENKCPQCNLDFKFGTQNIKGTLYCKCGFSIEEGKYKKIIKKMREERIKEWGNPSLLIGED